MSYLNNWFLVILSLTVILRYNNTMLTATTLSFRHKSNRNIDISREGRTGSLYLLKIYKKSILQKKKK